MWRGGTNGGDFLGLGLLEPQTQREEGLPAAIFPCKTSLGEIYLVATSWKTTFFFSNKNRTITYTNCIV